MVKLIGAACILIACTWIGFEFARHLSKRPKHLRLFRSSLQALEAEIMFGHTPLQEAAVRLSKSLPEPINRFFAAFAKELRQQDTNVKTAWDNSLSAFRKVLALKQNEMEILMQFGETLGRHDRYQQQKQIILTMTHLEREETEALQVQSKYEKMMKSLGFLSGLLLIILLV
ncbi:MAG: stage III sporulation protein SpoIIIAB [Bacillus sp. (in: firmicutes)]